MESSSTTSATNEILHNLELECQYLTRALSKLERHSPEWKYMLHRLELANIELDERRRDLVGAIGEEAGLVPLSSSLPSTSPSLPTGGRIVIEVPPDRRDNLAMMNGVDRHDRSRPIDEKEGCVLSPLQDDVDDDDASFAPFVMRDTDSAGVANRKKMQTCLRLSLLSIMLITGILLVALNIGKQSTTLSVIEEGVSPSDHQNFKEPCASLSLRLIPDQFGNETTWKVLHYEADDGGMRNSSDRNFTVVFSGGPYPYRSELDNFVSGTHFGRAIVAKTCLPIGSYKFIIYDVRGDGICCDYGRGEYEINLSKGRVIHPLSSISFSSEREAISFVVTEDDIDIYPAASTASLPTTMSKTTPPPNDDGVNSALETASPDSDAQNSLDESNLDTIALDTIQPSTDDEVYSLNNLVTALKNDTMTGRGKAYGILFDIENAASTFSFVIKGMDLYLATTSPTHYEIWSKEGSWQDVIGDNPDYSEGFRLVAHGTISGEGASKLTEISLHEFHDVEIQGGHRHAFWVTLSDDSLVFQNYEREGISRHELESIVQASREDFRVYFGAAVRAYPLELADPITDYWYNAGFLGRIWYKESPNNRSKLWI